jgi:hypothetical protein
LADLSVVGGLAEKQADQWLLVIVREAKQLIQHGAVSFSFNTSRRTRSSSVFDSLVSRGMAVFIFPFPLVSHPSNFHTKPPFFRSL